MGYLTIRDLPEPVHQKLRVRAAQHGRSLQEEVRQILSRTVTGVTGPELLRLAERHFGRTHGVDLELPPRTDDRRPPDFAE